MHLFPVGDPADGTRHGENHGKHRRRNTHRFQNNAGVEIDVRIEFALDKVGVVQRDMLQLHRHFQQVILHAQLVQHFMAGLTHHGGARVVVLVNAVTKAHQAERVVFIFRAAHKFRNMLNGADLFQHTQSRFVRAAVRRSPQRGDARGDTGERVGAGRACGAHGRRRGVLLMVGVQDKNTVHGAFQHRVHLVLFARGGEHHMQEVAGVGEIVARINERLTDRIFVTHCRHGRHLRQQTERGDFTVTLVIHIQRIVIKGSQRAGHAAHHRHWVGVATEAVEQTGNLLMDHGMTGYGLAELFKLLLRRRFAVQQDIAYFQIVRVGRQLIDREAAMQQNAFIAVDKGDFGFAGRCRGETRVKGEKAAGAQGADINHILPKCALQHVQLKSRVIL